MTTMVTLPEQVAERLQADIYAGTYPIGGRLPSERKLAASLGVHRSVIREALTRLGRTGLVETRRGSGSTVLDFRATASLDMLEGLVAGGPDAFSRTLLLDVMDFRLAYGAGLAELAARHGRSGDVVELERALTRLIEAADLEAWSDAEGGYIAALVACTHNLVYELIERTLARSFKASGGLAALLFSHRRAVERGYAAVTAAVTADDVAGAGEHMRELMSLERSWLRSSGSS